MMLKAGRVCLQKKPHRLGKPTPPVFTLFDSATFISSHQIESLVTISIMLSKYLRHTSHSRLY